MMMRDVAEDYRRTGVSFLVLAVTKKAVREALKEGKKHGLADEEMTGRVMTLHSYLINKRFPADLVCVDEFAMAHVGQVDAATSYAGASVIRMYGDGRQIPYDPFTAELKMHYASVASGVKDDQIRWYPETHRLREDVCAAWLDFYPEIYPCKCHRADEKGVASMAWKRIGGVMDIRKPKAARVHTYTRAELDEVADGLRYPKDRRAMELMVNDGVVTVHKDQGSTHTSVVTVRTRADFDKNSTKRNPSLYNRYSYVLTDQTRHTGSYVYMTASSERDVVLRRVELSKDARRLALVRNRKGMGLSTLSDMLHNRYHDDIVSGKSER